MNRQYFYINVEDGDLVYDVLERLLQGQELARAREELEQVKRDLKRVGEELAEAQQRATREELLLSKRKDMQLLMSKEIQLLKLTDIQESTPRGRIDSYPHLEFLSGSTLIHIDEALSKLLESGVGMSKEQSLHIVQKSEFFC